MIATHRCKRCGAPRPPSSSPCRNCGKKAGYYSEYNEVPGSSQPTVIFVQQPAAETGKTSGSGGFLTGIGILVLLVILAWAMLWGFAAAGKIEVSALPTLLQKLIPSQLYSGNSLTLSANPETGSVQYVTVPDMEPPPNLAGPIYDEDGNAIGCQEGGQFISFVDGSPNFVGPDGGVIEALLPKIAESSTWYCFDPILWQQWLDMEIGIEGYEGLTKADALTINIGLYSGVKGEIWDKAIRSAIKASKGQAVLVLPGKVQRPASEVNSEGYSYDEGNYAGQSAAPTVFQPEPPTAVPTATPTPLSPADTERMQAQGILEGSLGADGAAQALQKGGDDAVFKLPETDLMDVLNQQGPVGSVIAELSPDGLEVRPGVDKYVALSTRVALDGRRLFKFVITGMVTKVPGTNDGVWNLSAGAFIRYQPILPSSGGANFWGKDSKGYEVPWGKVWVYPVSIKPAAPAATPTIDENAIATMIAFSNSLKTPTAVPPQPPAPTPTPQPPKPAGNVFDLQNAIDGAGLTKARGTIQSWPNRILFEINGKRAEYDLWYVAYYGKPMPGTSSVWIQRDTPDVQAKCVYYAPGWWACNMVPLEPGD